MPPCLFCKSLYNLPRPLALALILPPAPRKRILGESSRQGLLAADLLTSHEGVDRDGDGAVDVLGGDVVREAHA